MKRRSLAIIVSILLSISAAGCALSAEGQPASAATTAAAEVHVTDARKGIDPIPAVDASNIAKELSGAEGAPTAASTDSAEDDFRVNPKGPKLRGRFYWTDELVYFDWRIQRHADNGQYRLIDGEATRREVGTFAQCHARLESIKQEQKLPPLAGKVVLVLHGLGRSRASNADMVEHLRDNSRFTVLSVGYASTQADVATHARSLARVIENLGDQVTEINFVAHSLGNIVIRHYLADHTDAQNGRRPDARIHRIVMVGAPNNGARMAEFVGQNSLFERITGQSGRALARDWPELRKHLAVPETEFGIIAGGQNDGSGYNPLLPGDDDFIVAVEETKLPGARDFVVIEGLHALMMINPEVQEASLRFLEHGYFVSEAKRQPLPATPMIREPENRKTIGSRNSGF